MPDSNLMHTCSPASPFDTIKIVMVHTTLPANIGAALRAMKTMGLTRLVLVQPKFFPHPDIDALAAGAADLIEQIEIVEQLETAIADCELVLATSARQRAIPWPLINARQASTLCQQHLSQQHQIAIIFGREDRGLTNDELALAHYHVTIPVNPNYGVLNVAQAIQIICYELRMSCLELLDSSPTMTALEPSTTDEQHWDAPLVNHQQMQQFYQQFERLLEQLEFFDPQHPRLLPLRIKRLFNRIQLDQIEYHLLRGVFSRTQQLLAGTWQPQSKRPTQGESDA